VTFTYAGLQKLTNRFFFEAANPGSIQAQLHASITSSPIGPLIRLSAHEPVLVGLLIAFGELAVGLGTLCGLLGRVAAGGGMAVSLLLFLSVSFNTTPYFYGSDIVFLFAWTPLLIGGSGAWSVDAALAARHDRQRAAARVLADQQAPDLDRSAAIRKVASVLTLAGFAVASAAIAAAVGRMFHGTSVQASGAPPLSRPAVTSPGASSSKGTVIGLASDVPLGGAREFTDPAQGIPAYVVRPSEDSYVGFSAVCTHMGCTVGFFQPALQFRCPCHGSIYSAVTGEVLQGPAPSPLPGIPIEKSASGALLANG
jgi:thiosulfate dehydrogenase [quinone] large subunit